MKPKTKRMMTLLFVTTFLIGTLCAINGFFPTAQNTNVRTYLNYPDEIEVIDTPTPRSSDEVTANSTSIAGNSTHFYANTTVWNETSDYGQIYGQDGGTIQTFNISDIDSGYSAHYINVTVGNLTLGPKDVTIQDGNGGSWGGFSMLAQPFNFTSPQINYNYSIISINVTLIGLSSLDSLEMFIYNNTPTYHPDTNITNGITLNGKGTDGDTYEYSINFTEGDFPILTEWNDLDPNNTYYYIVLKNKTGNGFSWVYFDDGVEDTSYGYQYWFSGSWNFHLTREFTSSITIDIFDNCNASDHSMKGTANNGPEIDLTDVETGIGNAEFENVIPDAFGNIAINITTDSDWDAQFDYSYEIIASRNNGQPIPSHPNSWMYRTVPNGTTEWNLTIRDLAIGDGNNSLLLNIPNDWTDITVTDDDLGVLDCDIKHADIGTLIRLSENSDWDLGITATDSERITGIDNGRDADQTGSVFSGSWDWDWHQTDFTAEVDLNVAGNVSHYLYYENGTLKDSLLNDDTSPHVFSHGFSPNDPREDYLLVAFYYNGTSADSVNATVPYRYKIEIDDSYAEADELLIVGGKDEWARESSGDPRTYLVEDDLSYTMNVTWDGKESAWNIAEFNKSATFYPFDDFQFTTTIADSFGISSNATACVYNGSGSVLLSNTTVNETGVTNPFIYLSESPTLLLRLYYLNGTQVTDFDWIGSGQAGISELSFDAFNDLASPMNFKVNDDLSENTDDAYDGNHDFGSAVVLGNGTYNLYLNDTEDDYFNVSMSEGNTLKVDLAFDADLGNIDVILHAPDQSQVANSTENGDEETLNHTATQIGIYTVRVHRSMLRRVQNYSMTINDNYPIPSGTSGNDGTENARTKNGGDDGMTIPPEVIVIAVIVAIAVASILLILSKRKKGAPKTEKKKTTKAKLPKTSEKEKREIATYFKDVTSMHGILLIQKESGTCISKASYLLGGGLNEDLISGFMNAFGSIKHEIGNMMGRQTTERKKAEVMEWNEFVGTLIDGAFSTIIIVSDHRIGETLEKRVNQLIDAYENDHFTELKYHDGKMSHFTDFPGIVERDIDGALNLKSTLDIDRLTSVKGFDKVKKVLSDMYQLDELTEFYPAKIPSILMREMGISKVDANYLTYVMHSFLVFKPLKSKD